MMYAIMFVAGVLVGWHVPQPAWAVSVMNTVKNFFKKKEDTTKAE